MVISYFPSSTSQHPLCCSTEPRIWKNCPTLSSSESPDMEFILVNATLAKREVEDKSPGSPSPPIPRL